MGALLVALLLSSAVSLSRRRGSRRSRASLGSLAAFVAALALALGLVSCGTSSGSLDVPEVVAGAPSGSALAALGTLPVKGRAPKSGYARTQFGPPWEDVDRNGCDTRDDILRRDLTGIRIRAGSRGCVVLAGTLLDPYTGRSVAFAKSAADQVQIDHVVALSDAWQTGAQAWNAETRLQFANDPLNLLAVEGNVNQDKGDGDAATWLPPAKGFRCAYVSRQVAVKVRYRLWVTPAEQAAMARVLRSCPSEGLP